MKAKNVLYSALHKRHPLYESLIHRGDNPAIVPRVGLEPTQPIGQGILSPSCLPFHHLGDLKKHTVGACNRVQK